MDDSHITFKENLSAYALSALDAGETIALESHLQACESCRAELAEYRRISAGLLSALPPRPPRPALKRILQKRLVTPRPQSRFSFGQIAIASAFIVLIALNIASLLQIYSLKRQQVELSNQYYSEQTAIAMLAYPGTQPISFDQNGISGSLLVDGNRNLLAVFAWHLPPTPAGKTYQMWLIDAKGDRTSGGLLTPDADQPFVMAMITSSVPLKNFTGLGVTLEPSGGSLQPTGPKVLRVDF